MRPKLNKDCQQMPTITNENIPGVPEGCKITGLIPRWTDTTSGPHPGVYYEAIVERIKKPKQKWLIIECKVVSDDDYCGKPGTIPRSTANRHLEGKYFPCRIEERDA